MRFEQFLLIDVFEGTWANGETAEVPDGVVEPRPNAAGTTDDDVVVNAVGVVAAQNAGVTFKAENKGAAAVMKKKKEIYI